jgi:hypothetical protein
MSKRIAAILLIYAATAIAWIALGNTIVSRTDSSRVGLGEKVASNWGTEQSQSPPSAKYVEVVTEGIIGSDAKVRPVTKNVDVAIPLQSSDVRVSFNLDYRQKGLLWYTTYKVAYSATYTFLNATAKDQKIFFRFKLPRATGDL